MNCPNQGQLLLYAEKQLTDDEYLRIYCHVKTCKRCAKTVEEIKQTLNFVCTRMLPVDKPINAEAVPGQERIWENINRRMNTNKREGFKMKIKRVSIAAAVVLALVIVGSIPSVQTAAANFLQVFRVQEVDTLTLTPADMNQIERAVREGTSGQSIDFESFGTINVEGQQQETSLNYDQLGSIGFACKLPGNIDPSQGQYTLQSMPAVEITPNVEKVNAFISALGSSQLLPESLEGKTFQIKMGKCLVASFEDFRLVQGPSPELEAPGDVKVSEIAEAMVALPIWPDNVRRQLESVSDWQHTLLIPGENNEKVKVNGQDAVLMKDNSNHILIWQENGLVYSLEDYSGKNLDLVEIAESMR
jgi:hypothetical protein